MHCFLGSPGRKKKPGGRNCKTVSFFTTLPSNSTSNTLFESSWIGKQRNLGLYLKTFSYTCLPPGGSTDRWHPWWKKYTTWFFCTIFTMQLHSVASVAFLSQLIPYYVDFCLQYVDFCLQCTVSLFSLLPEQQFIE